MWKGLAVVSKRFIASSPDLKQRDAGTLKTSMDGTLCYAWTWIIKRCCLLYRLEWLNSASEALFKAGRDGFQPCLMDTGAPVPMPNWERHRSSFVLLRCVLGVPKCCYSVQESCYRHASCARHGRWRRGMHKHVFVLTCCNGHFSKLFCSKKKPIKRRSITGHQSSMFRGLDLCVAVLFVAHAQQGFSASVCASRASS